MELLWTDFLNSEWHDWRGSGKSEDRLEKNEWLQKFIVDWKLFDPGNARPKDIVALRAFRNLLRRMAEALAAGKTVGAKDIRAFNAVLAGGPVVRRIEDHNDNFNLNLTPLKQDWTQVMAEIAASFAATLCEGERGRIRICDNPDCLWVFYDDTRNRSKRFCDDKSCGNLMKVRRFRARRKVAASRPNPNDGE